MTAIFVCSIGWVSEPEPPIAGVLGYSRSWLLETSLWPGSSSSFNYNLKIQLNNNNTLNLKNYYTICIRQSNVDNECFRRMVFTVDDLSTMGEDVNIVHTVNGDYSKDDEEAVGEEEDYLLQHPAIVEEVNLPSMDKFASQQRSFREGFIRYNGYIMPRSYLQV